MDSKIYVFVCLFLFLYLWKIIHISFFKWLTNRLEGRHLFVIDKLSYYAVFIVATLISLRLIGANVSDLLATAGLLTVAIGFAAKTSMSHFISGFILLGTRLIKHGDIIEVGEHIGMIENIDMFSTHLRTFDHVLVSLPNEKLLTEYVSNYSHYSLRRISCDFLIQIEDLNADLVTQLEEQIKQIQMVLVEPEPLVVMTSEMGRGIKLSIRAWCESSKLIEARNQMILEITVFLTQRQVRFVTERLVH